MTSVQQITDQEIAQFGWVDSIATNSISDFKSYKVNVDKNKTDEKEFDFTDVFICHLIFYVLFCYSLLLYVFIDLEFISFLKNLVNKFIKSTKLRYSPFFSFLHDE